MTAVSAPEGTGQTYAVKGNAFGLAIIVLSGMYFLSVLDGTVVFVAMPKIQDGLHLSDATKVWVFGAYAVAFGGLMLLGGRLGDTFGRKKMFIYGVSGFTVTSGLAGAAGAMDGFLGLSAEVWLLVARTLQGASAAVACPTALALVATTFAPGKARNQAFAIFAAMAGVGSVSGLVAGGVLATWHWSLVFLISVPAGLACAIGGYIALEESSAERRHSLDVRGAVLAVVGCASGVYGATAGPEGWSRPSVVIAFALAAVCLVMFLVVERGTRNPILPFSLFRNRNRVATMIAILICGAVIPTMGFYVSLTFQQVLGYEPWQSGVALMPFAVGMGVSSAVSAKLATMVQARWLVALGGIVVLLPCLFVYATIDAYASNPSRHDAHIAYFPQIAVPVFIIGLGVGLALIPLTLCIVAGVKPNEIGPLTALTEVAQNLGGVGGLAIVQVLVTSRIMSKGGPTSGEMSAVPGLRDVQLHALASGYGLAFLACAAIVVLAGIVVVPFMRFTPEQVAEGQAVQESNKSGGAIPSTSFPALAFHEDEAEDEWEPIEGDVTSGTFPAVKRSDYELFYNESPDDPEPAPFTDRIPILARRRTRAPDPEPDESATTALPLGAPSASRDEPPTRGTHPSDPVPRRPEPPLSGVARDSGEIRRSADIERPSGFRMPERNGRVQAPAPRPAQTPPTQAVPVQRPVPAGQGFRPSGPVQRQGRPSAPMPRQGAPAPRPSGPMQPRPSAPVQRPPQPAAPQAGFRASAPIPRPSGPVQRPSGPVQRPSAPLQRGDGRHAAPDASTPDSAASQEGRHSMRVGAQSPQADRVSRARRHRQDD
ncbi:MFS transporter [Tsukamurella sp. 8F]|uniref:MFS transporter n=1 Tax=unclassified Tsukamurella TaxID=2633480 RepID=UPI0023B98694|nr:MULTISPECIES: MDR family MFS transporter [unclassified Tsukamurella]MDF0531607.1 MFS transporter [Tsukamurella sp. 8J]MDF0587546.1 MFS transporter [Tsukamurella sp. 8F]